MLKKFKVRNFKNFRDEIELDLGNIKNYEFNENAVKNEVIKSAVIYGENASGKTNLGHAICDITAHLTETNRNAQTYMQYSNLYTEDNTAYFEYTFQFGKDSLVYSYEKKNIFEVLREKLTINNKEIVWNQDNVRKTTLKGAEHLNLNLWQEGISFVKYIATNTILDMENNDCRVFQEFIEFVSGMLFFTNTAGNRYIGFSNRHGTICEEIIKLNGVKELESFLHEMKIEYQLEEGDDGDKKNIYCIFGKKRVPLERIWSSGTRALSFLFYWLKQIERISFVFIDEYDAFYHYELSEMVAKKLFQANTQVILTSHNTDLITNELLRPDCYFEIRDNKIGSFADATSKALRQAHNLQKMYKAGAFNE